MEPSELDDLRRRAEEMQRRVLDVQAELKRRVFEGEASGGIKARVNGAHELVSLDIPEDATSDREQLATSIVDAVNSALESSKRAIEEAMAKATDGISMPGS